MWNSVTAELLLLRKRTSTWILLGLATALGAGFVYILPYVSYLQGSSSPSTPSLPDLLPTRLVGTLLEGYPFYAGMIVLILGALTFGSEYTWGTWKTAYTQRPGRLQIFASKLASLGIALTAFVLVPFVICAVISYVIAVRESQPVVWPGAWLIVRGLAAGWLLMAVWAALGVLLAVISRGTALAIGVGILYGLVLEGLISSFASGVSALHPLTDVFLRTNGYSLIQTLGISLDQVKGDGPGGFSGPYVGTVQALLVLMAYLVGFALAAATLLRRQEVS